MIEKLLFIPFRENRVHLLEKLQLLSLYIISLLLIIIVPVEIFIILIPDKAWMLIFLASFSLVLDIVALIIFFKTRNIIYSQRILAIIIIILITGVIVSGGGRFGLSSLYFIAAFSIFFLILDYTTGIILPIYYLIAMTLRLKFGSFTPESIFSNPTLRSRFSIVLILGTVFGILGSITINILIKHLSNLAFNDSKTGLPNSQKFKETFNDIINHCNLGVDQCVLVGIRIINLERIYANLGLYMGDKIILEIVKRLKFEQFKLLARWNESIFMGVFTVSDILELEEKTKDLHKKIELNYEVEGISRSVQFILALSRYPNDGLSSDSIIKNVITLLGSRNKNHEDIIYMLTT